MWIIYPILKKSFSPYFLQEDSKWLGLLKEFCCMKVYYGGYDNLQIFYFVMENGKLCGRVQGGNKDELLQNLVKSLFVFWI